MLQYQNGDHVLVKGTDDDENSPEMVVTDHTFVNGLAKYYCVPLGASLDDGDWYYEEDIDLVAQ